MNGSIEGIYAGYMTGAEGNGFSMFVFINGIVSGVDPLGVKFDGTYCAKEHHYDAAIKVTVPSGGMVIQGASAGSAGMTYTVTIKLEPNFAQLDHIRIDTPLGPANLRLRKLRGLGEAN